MNFKLRGPIPIALSAALCIVAKRVQDRPIVSRNVGRSFRLVQFSPTLSRPTPLPQTGVELGAGHNLTLELRPKSGR